MKPLKILMTAAAGAIFASQTGLAEISAEKIEASTKRTIEAFDLVGLGVTVVSGDAVIFQDVYGVKDVRQSSGKIDTDTLFPFASIGKAFTTAALAMLVDEGKLGWDDPVRNFIPEFEMSDPYITAEFSVRDLVTHRSGLPLGAGDLLIVPDGKPEVADILAAIRHIPPETSFRSEYAYDNLMYIIAGEVLARIEGRPWAEVIRTRIFEPVGMTSCKAVPSEGAAADNTITQHLRTPGSRVGEPIDPRYIMGDATSPAGGLSCSITDLAKWGQFWLNDATTASGVQLISPAQAKELWTGVTPQRVDAMLSQLGGTHFSLYGLGWVLRDFHGELLVSHSGGLLGATAFFGILPETDVAVFVTSNDFTPAASALALQILSDLAKPDAASDWIGVLEGYYVAQQDTAQQDAGLADGQATEEAVKPVRPLSAYIGTYADPWYGSVSIQIRDNSLFIDMSRSEVLDGPLKPVAPDRFVARWPDRTLNADAYVVFSEEAGEVTGMNMMPVSDTTDFSFNFKDLSFVRQR